MTKRFVPTIPYAHYELALELMVKSKFAFYESHVRTARKALDLLDDGPCPTAQSFFETIAKFVFAERMSHSLLPFGRKETRRKALSEVLSRELDQNVFDVNQAHELRYEQAQPYEVSNDHREERQLRCSICGNDSWCGSDGCPLDPK